MKGKDVVWLKGERAEAIIRPEKGTGKNQPSGVASLGRRKEYHLLRREGRKKKTRRRRKIQ